MTRKDRTAPKVGPQWLMTLRDDVRFRTTDHAYTLTLLPSGHWHLWSYAASQGWTFDSATRAMGAVAHHHCTGRGIFSHSTGGN